MDESHIEHTIRLIEDEYLYIREGNMPLTDKIHETTWSRDEDIDSFLEGVHLIRLTDSAEYDSGPELRMTTICREALLYLHCELTSRSEDERTNFAFFLSTWSNREELDNRYGKCSSLTCTCLSTSEEISSLEDDGDGLLLDRSWCRISLFFEGSENRLD